MNNEEPKSFIEAIINFSQQIKEWQTNQQNSMFSWSRKQDELNTELHNAITKIDYLRGEVKELLEAIERKKK